MKASTYRKSRRGKGRGRSISKRQSRKNSRKTNRRRSKSRRRNSRRKKRTMRGGSIIDGNGNIKIPLKVNKIKVTHNYKHNKKEDHVAPMIRMIYDEITDEEIVDKIVDIYSEYNLISMNIDNELFDTFENKDKNKGLHMIIKKFLFSFCNVILNNTDEKTKINIIKKFEPKNMNVPWNNIAEGRVYDGSFELPEYELKQSIDVVMTFEKKKTND